MTGSSRLSCPGIVSGTTWCSIGQRREKGRVQQGGARHCRISVKIRRLLRKNTQTWVLSSVAKFVLCADSLHPRKARFPSFHIVCRCVFASFDSSTFWLLSFSALFAVLWFCLLCFYDRILHSFAKKQFVFFACIFGRRNNGLKFRSGLPVAAILRCGSA